ncbi:MAG: hypothetical protein P8Y68_10995 [Anaerolineales bacterium]
MILIFTFGFGLAVWLFIHLTGEGCRLKRIHASIGTGLHGGY